MRKSYFITFGASLCATLFLLIACHKQQNEPSIDGPADMLVLGNIITVDTTNLYAETAVKMFDCKSYAEYQSTLAAYVQAHPDLFDNEIKGRTYHIVKNLHNHYEYHLLDNG